MRAAWQGCAPARQAREIVSSFGHMTLAVDGSVGCAPAWHVQKKIVSAYRRLATRERNPTAPFSGIALSKRATPVVRERNPTAPFSG
jgi:hypothetical protein